MRRIRIIGITGGVGAGKSAALSYLEQMYGALVLQADQIGHLVMKRDGGSCYQAIKAHFGEKILTPELEIDRKRLGEIVFSDPEELAFQEALIHPAVKAYIKERIRQVRQEESHPLIVIEAALLLEDHYEEICDELWYLYAAEETRRVRLKESRGYTEEQISRILESQQSEEGFRAGCQVTIDNSRGLKELYAQLDACLKSRGIQRKGLGE